MSKRKYHKSNCDATVRAIVEDALGRKVILVGKHAFEWSIILEKEGKLVITTFPNREKAVDTFNNKYTIVSIIILYSNNNKSATLRSN